MKLTAKVKLQTTPEQYRSLLETLERANAACDQISEIAWKNRVFNQFRLHKLTYYSIRESSGLSAQMTVRCISKVTDSYKLDRKTKRTFNPHGSIAYDDRIIKWYVDRQTVSIWTTQGRMTIPFLAGKHQHDLLKYQHGETDLGFVDDVFYLFATCEKETPEPIDVEGMLGVDLGIVNIATTSDGDTFAGNHINNVRHRHRRLRKKLQAKQTKSAKRRLKKLSGRESRFASHTNHVISKQIVEAAKDTNRAIAVEKLTGIRSRATVRRGQRDNLHSWSFYQLKSFISYKAMLAGVPLIEVDPRNTSRLCPVCGCVDKANRKSQSSFLCVSCDYAANADHNAAVNIARRAAVSRPNISITSTVGSHKRGTVVAN